MPRPPAINFRWSRPPQETSGTLLLAPREYPWLSTSPLFGRASCPHHVRLYKGPLPYSLLAWFCPSPRYLIISCCPTAHTPGPLPDLPATMERHRTLFTKFDEATTTELLGPLLPHPNRSTFSIHEEKQGPCSINFGLPPDILAAPIARGACLPLIPGRYPYVFRDVRLIGAQAWIALPPFPTPST